MEDDIKAFISIAAIFLVLGVILGQLLMPDIVTEQRFRDEFDIVDEIVIKQDGIECGGLFAKDYVNFTDYHIELSDSYCLGNDPEKVTIDFIEYGVTLTGSYYSDNPDSMLNRRWN